VTGQDGDRRGGKKGKRIVKEVWNGDTTVVYACTCFGVPIRDATEYTRESRVGTLWSRA